MMKLISKFYELKHQGQSIHKLKENIAGKLNQHPPEVNTVTAARQVSSLTATVRFYFVVLVFVMFRVFFVCVRSTRGVVKRQVSTRWTHGVNIRFVLRCSLCRAPIFCGGGR